MKTTIQINGPLVDNVILRDNLKSPSTKILRTRFNGFSITYQSKKEAYMALKQAYLNLMENSTEQNRNKPIHLPKYALVYNSSCAIIK